MIDITTVTIGNDILRKEITKVTPFKASDHIFKIANSNDLLKVLDDPYRYDPIKLTDEILIQYGFKRKGKNQHVKHFGYWTIYLIKNLNHYKIGIDDGEDMYRLPRAVFHLHQLQNIYRFSITGNFLEPCELITSKEWKHNLCPKCQSKVVVYSENEKDGYFFEGEPAVCENDKCDFKGEIVSSDSDEGNMYLSY